jgi:hypothetical protein
MKQRKATFKGQQQNDHFAAALNFWAAVLLIEK